MKKLFLLSLFTFSFSFFTLCFGQKRAVDSLHSVLKTEQEDTNRLNTLCTLSEILWRGGNYDSSLVYITQAKALAEKITDSRESATAKAGKNGLATAYKTIGIIYRHRGNFPKALEYELKALDLCQQTGNKNGIAANLGNIGVVYWSMNNFDKALEYDLKALALNQETGNKNFIAANIGNIGILYRLKGDYTKALEYDFKALAMKQDIGDKQGIAANLGNIGLVYMHMGNYEKSLEYDFKALALVREIGQKEGVAINLSNLGATYTGMKKFAIAKAYLDSGMAISKSINEADEVKNIYDDLHILDSATGNYKAEAEDYKKFIFYRDSLLNEANTKKAMQSEMDYEFDQKQAAEKAEQDKKDAIAEQERKKQAIIRNSFIGGFALMLALAFFIFRSYRQKQKANTIIIAQKKEVEQQKALVEEKNKDITDSIHYASRIQRALLTTDGYIGKRLKDYFILFKPRDIVSGDFYWANEVNENGRNRFLICAGDCTGHGVPGAFMSLLNISILNETTLEKKVHSPAAILNEVRKHIIKALNPEGAEADSKDGMDCVLCSFDMTNNTLDFACANNPLWLIRNKECIEYAADKMPVGVQGEKDIPFRLQSADLQKGDCVYLFTDGYADQFGGPKGKKFMYKNLSEKLKVISEKPMAEQKALLEKTLEEWKGNLEQVDDILIIGIRV